MDGLLILGFLLQAFYFTLFVIYIRNRWAKKRFKEESLNLDESVVEVTPVLETEDIGFLPGTSTIEVYVNPMSLRERYGGILEEKEDFIPKKKMRYHTLEEPIEHYSENEAEDEGCGCDTVCNCYDTIYGSL